MFCHLYDGQEAVDDRGGGDVGDSIVTSYRDHTQYTRGDWSRTCSAS